MKRYYCLLGILLFPIALSAAEAISGPGVGTVAPDFKVRNIVTGENVTLSSQRGKVVILTFWASWCPPCKREIPILERAQELVSKDNLMVLAVSYRDSQAALAAVKKIAAKWQINLMEDHNDRVAHLYSITKIPHLFMIGRDGKVVANHVGYGDRTLKDLVADINQALAAPRPDE